MNKKLLLLCLSMITCLAKAGIPEDILFEGVKTNNLSMIQEAIDCGVNLDAKLDQDGNTALHYALQLGHVEVIQGLLLSGATPIRPVIKTCFSDHYNVEAVAPILDAAAEPNNFSTLHVAARYNDPILTKHALTYIEVDRQSETRGDFTPLHLAAHYGSLESASILLTSGANLNIKDIAQESAAEWPVKKISMLLKENKIDPELEAAISTQLEFILMILYDKLINKEFVPEDRPVKASAPDCLVD